jgi:hypothetical protein
MALAAASAFTARPVPLMRASRCRIFSRSKPTNSDGSIGGVLPSLLNAARPVRPTLHLRSRYPIEATRESCGWPVVLHDGGRSRPPNSAHASCELP